MRAATARTASLTTRGVGQRLPRQAEDVQQAIDVDPIGGAVVVGEARFELVVGQRQAFHQARAIVHAGESAAAILEVARNHFGGQPRAAGDVLAQKRGVHVRRSVSMLCTIR